jgi:hypothetical protein
MRLNGDSVTADLARLQSGPSLRRYHRVVPPGGTFVLSVFVMGCSASRLGLSAAPSRPIFDLLRSSPEEQRNLSNWFRQDRVWSALTRRTTLEQSLKRAIEHAGRIVTVYKRASRVAACKGSFKSGILKAIQSREYWVLWASTTALGVLRDEANSDTVDLAEPAQITGRLGQRADGVRELKRRADSIRLTADGLVPLDLTCPSLREALLGPTGAAYTRSGVVVATDG